MNISEPFIRRPIATSLLMLGVLVFGIGAYGLLPVAALPNVDFPTIVVSVTYPGASPDTMASAVATPLEQQFAAIPALDQMTSTSGIGSLSITLQFDLSRNIDAAAEDVQQAINAASGLLPPDLPSPPTYRKTNPADRPVLIYAVHSDALPISRVNDFAYTILAQKLSTVPGVSESRIFGQQNYAPHVQINPGSLASRGLGFEDVRNALVATTLDRPKGSLEGAHQTYTLDANDQLFNAAAYNNVIIAYRNGAPVRVKDVGRAVDSVQYAHTGAWFFDTKAEGLAIQRQAGANTIQLVDTIKAMVPRIMASFPPSIKVDLVSDRSLVIRAAVHDVQFTMMVTISLVVLVIFLFLRTLWATIIPSLAVPLSLLATFAVMYAVGYNLDNISLMALTISVGFIVDDSVVMIENIVRYIEMGQRPFEAALKGAGQIGFTIVSITFSLIAVFIPLLFMGGIIGRLFREFAVTVSVAVVASAAISLTLTPVLCSLFLKERALQQAGRVNRTLGAGFDWTLRVYDRGLNFVFRHQLPTFLSTLGLIVLTGYLYVTIPKGFFPEQDTGFIFGQADARQDISFNGMSKLVHQLIDVVRRDPDISGVFAFTGATAYNPTENTARMFMQLKPHDQRSLTSNQIIQRLRPKVAAVQGVRFFMQSGQDISVGGRLSRTLYQYTLTDTDPDELYHWAPILEQAMKKLPELQDVASDQQVAAPHIGIDIDRDAASRMGISPSLIDATLYDAFSTGGNSPLAPLPFQYADYAHWQRRWKSNPEIVAQLAYWREQLREPLPNIELAKSGDRSALDNLRTARRRWVLPASLAEAARRFSRQEGGTLFMALVAALKTLLHRYLGQDDLRVATNVANRNRPGTELLIGPLVNTVVLRTNLGGDPSPREVLRRVRTTTLEAFEHQDLPFEELALTLETERDLRPESLAQVMILLQNTTLRPRARSEGSLAFEEADPTLISPLVTTTTFDAIFAMVETRVGLVGTCIYKPNLFSVETIDRLVRDFERTIEQMVARPERPISAIRVSGMRNDRTEN